MVPCAVKDRNSEEVMNKVSKRPHCGFELWELTERLADELLDELLLGAADSIVGALDG